MNQPPLKTKLIPPLTLLVSIIILSSFPPESSGLLNFFLFYSGMIIHELGHTIFGILSGRISLPFFFITFDLGYSILVHILIALSLLLGSLYLCYYQEWFFGIITSGLAIFCLLNFFLSSDTTSMIFTLGGLINELVGSTLLISLFYYPLKWPRNWHQLRYPILMISCAVFSDSAIAWTRSLSDPSNIPYPPDSAGGINFVAVMQLQDAINGAPTGDLDKLLRIYHWTQSELIYFHVGLALACLALLSAKVLLELLKITAPHK